MAKKQFSPEVIWVPTEKVIPYPHNNKVHPPSQIDSIAGCIVEYGFDVPIVIDEDGVILKGHGRHLAARKLGLKEVPVIQRTDLSPAQKKACRIADNKVAISDWNYEALKVELESLAEMDFNLDLTGFNLEECDSIFNLGTIDFQSKQIFGEDLPPEPRQAEPGIRGADVASGESDDEDQEVHSVAHSPEGEPLVKSDGSLLELVEVTIAEPRHQVQKGQVWKVGPHLLVIAEVMTEWQRWVKFLEGNAIFTPYPGPFVPLTVKGEDSKLVMVQPDEYMAGHLLDQYENVKGAGSVKLG